MCRLLSTCLLLVLGITIVSPCCAQPKKKTIVHDAEYYILEAQNGERWAAEDKALDARLAELRKKHGRPPNIIHIMWDDTAFGDLFAIRNAGNVLMEDVAGSIEYSALHLQTQLVVIMGHEGCGAVTAALNCREERAKETPELQQVLRWIDSAIARTSLSERRKRSNESS